MQTDIKTILNSPVDRIKNFWIYFGWFWCLTQYEKQVSVFIGAKIMTCNVKPLFKQSQETNFWLSIRQYIDAADNQRLDGSKWQKSNLSTKFWMKSFNNLAYSTLNNFCQWCGVLLRTPLLQSVHQVKSIKMEFHIRPRWSSTFRLRFVKVKLEVTLMGHQVQEWSDHYFKFVMKQKNITYSWIIFSHPYNLLLEVKE